MPFPCRRREPAYLEQGASHLSNVQLRYRIAQSKTKASRVENELLRRCCWLRARLQVRFDPWATTEIPGLGKASPQPANPCSRSDPSSSCNTRHSSEQEDDFVATPIQALPGRGRLGGSFVPALRELTDTTRGSYNR